MHIDHEQRQVDSQPDEAYEPPVVEDLDAGRGLVATAPGAPPSSFTDVSTTFTAPRDL